MAWKSDIDSDDTPGAARQRLITALRWSLGGLSALVLFTMMVVTVVDVVGRYFFNSPLPGAAELNEIGLGLLVFAALPLITARGGHVTIDLLSNLADKLGTHKAALFQRVQEVCVHAVSAALLAIITWRLAFQTERMAGYGDSTSFLGIPLAPVGGFMTVCAGLAAVVALVLTVLTVRQGCPSDTRAPGV